VEMRGEESPQGHVKVLHLSVLCFGCTWLEGPCGEGDVLSKTLATNQLLSI